MSPKKQLKKNVYIGTTFRERYLLDFQNQSQGDRIFTKPTTYMKEYILLVVEILHWLEKSFMFLLTEQGLSTKQ